MKLVHLKSIAAAKSPEPNKNNVKFSSMNQKIVGTTIQFYDTLLLKDSFLC